MYSEKVFGSTHNMNNRTKIVVLAAFLALIALTVYGYVFKEYTAKVYDPLTYERPEKIQPLGRTVPCEFYATSAFFKGEKKYIEHRAGKESPIQVTFLEVNSDVRKWTTRSIAGTEQQ